MLDDAEPIAVLTSAGLRAGWGPAAYRSSTLDDPNIGTHSSSALPAPAAADLGQIIYASGATGAPKGVAITHANVTQLQGSLDAVLPPEQVWTQCRSLRLRLLGVGDLGRAAGQRTPGGGARGGGGLARGLPRTVGRGAGHVLARTPSAVGMLSPKGLESAALLVGGEPCPAEVGVSRCAPGRVMVNAYGPTERTVTRR